jgi:hypothetical protein
MGFKGQVPSRPQQALPTYLAYVMCSRAYTHFMPPVEVMHSEHREVALLGCLRVRTKFLLSLSKGWAKRCKCDGSRWEASNQSE